MDPVPILVSWSTGKDAAWALHELQKQPNRYEVRGIFTTVTPHFDRVSIHGTPRRILRMQAERLRLPLYEVPIPYPCTNKEYVAAMHSFLERILHLPPDVHASTLAFGDLFLENVRAYRENLLDGTGFSAIYPLWKKPTHALAQEMIAAGLRAIVTNISPESGLGPTFAGRWFDHAFLKDLPAKVDPLGENGEFHTCILDGPMLTHAIPAQTGEVVGRPVAVSCDGPGGTATAWYADVLLANLKGKASLL